jgi:hypothetical protein
MSRSSPERLSDRPPVLSYALAAQVAWRSIRVRLGRSLVTVSSVVLAVTFLLSVLGAELASARVWERLQAARQPADDAAWLRTVLERPRNEGELLRLLAQRPAAAAAWVPGLPAVPATAAVTMLDWIARLAPDQRYLLVRTATPVAWILDPATVWTGLDERLRAAGEEPPLAAEALVALGAARDDLAAALSALRRAEAVRHTAVAAAGGPDAVLDRWLAGAAPAELVTAGFPLDQLLPDEPSRREAAALAVGEDRLRAVAGVALLAHPDDKGRVAALAEALAGGRSASVLDQALGAASVAALRDSQARRRGHDRLAAIFFGLGYDPVAGRSRVFWLVVLSLLVCVVGIVNSMMMAVTERFREIATMKCLGAVDGFILKAFLIESAVIGGVGSLLGATLGLLLVLAQASWRFGGAFWSAPPAAGLALALLAALVCGLLLTVLGALLPAWKAARMHPIEAMRLEA